MNRIQVFFYAFPGLALAMPTIPVYVLLPTFYADTVGLGLTATGIALLAARIFDVLSDPLAGWLSDYKATPFGRRKPWIAAGALVAGPALILLFSPPDGAGVAYLIACTVALYLGWTFIQVPYTAWVADLSQDYHERSRLTGAREGAMILGILLAGAVPALLSGFDMTQSDSFTVLAGMTVCIGAIALYYLLRRLPDTRSSAKSVTPGFRETLSALRANRPFVRLGGAWFVNGLANGVPAALFPLYLTYVLGAEEAMKNGLIFLYFLAAVAAIPGWLWLSKRIGKHKSWVAAMALACAAFAFVPALEAGAFVAFGIICLLTGFALGADLALPPAIQADVVDYDRLKFKGERAGVFFAVWSMATKTALAVSVGVAFPLIEVFGFSTKTDNSAAALFALAVIYSLIPVVLKLAAMALVWGHPITERRHQAILKRLRARHAR